MKSKALIEAKLLVRQSDVGVISTISKKIDGYPFGSVTPFISDSEGKLYLYISDIAQHSINLTANNKMSVTIFNQGKSGDQNENARITIVGDCTKVAEQMQEEMLRKYILRFPDAKTYQKAHVFYMWEVKVERVRYIGGFGKIFWIKKEDWTGQPVPWDKVAESAMISHMNDDHQDAMELILHQHYAIKDPKVMMSGIITEGCYLYSNSKNYFVPFNDICSEQSDVRKQLVALTKAARAA
ncbi:DUF2470 domain-containing protein [Aliikangiella marina]|uniref:DUF2470 domain-containing protein n=1 Tax=Aliikangiella marina TaxID=1712262 RepID=A0A545TD78_9GAMM|nr:DUF2470 domain-containing protein [Aliikangiella marina]TQV75173.1 DUF2470 domain-containing protein [Aliikangiella marina]